MTAGVSKNIEEQWRARPDFATLRPVVMSSRGFVAVCGANPAVAAGGSESLPDRGHRGRRSLDEATRGRARAGGLRSLVRPTGFEDENDVPETRRNPRFS